MALVSAVALVQVPVRVRESAGQASVLARASVALAMVAAAPAATAALALAAEAWAPVWAPAWAQAWAPASTTRNRIRNLNPAFVANGTYPCTCYSAATDRSRRSIRL